MSQLVPLVREIKLALREQGLSYAAVARHLRLSEATVKRLFSRGSFTLQRVDGICGLLGLELSELVERMQRRELPRTQLTREQEQEIVSEPRLFLMTWLVLNKWSLAEIRQTYDFSEREAQRLLIRLDRLGIIELQPGNRSRLLVNPHLAWLPGGPIQQYVNRTLLKEYFAADFSHPLSEFQLCGVIASESALARIKLELQHALRDCLSICAEDKSTPFGQRNGAALVLALRPWQFSGFERFKRPPQD